MPIPLFDITWPPHPPPPVVDAVPVPHYATPTVLLTSASGRVLSLTGRGYGGVGRMSGMTGMGLGPPELFAEPLPDGDGSVYVGGRVGEKQVFIPAVIGGTGYVSLRESRRTLEDIVSDGPVSITIREPDTGANRTVSGWYAGGLEGDDGRSVAGVDWQTVGLVFRCLDPAWYGDEQVVSWKMTTGLARPFLSVSEDFFPVILGDSTVGGERSVVNTGDGVAWPTITVDGPGSAIEVENLTTGKSVQLTGALLVDEWVTFVSRPGVADVFDADGDVWDRVTLGSTLWPLRPGENDVKVTMAGATSASGVTMSWRPPHRSGR